MPNAASLIPAPPARPSLAKAEYQATTRDESAFAGLLDIGNEPAPPSPEKPSSRTGDVRDAKQSDTNRNSNEPARRTDEPADGTRNQNAAEAADPAKPTGQTSAAVSGDKSQSKTDAGVAGDKPDESSSDSVDKAADDTATAATVAAVETVIAVVTPVTIAQLADQGEVAAPSDPALVGATPPASVPIPSDINTEPVFSMTAAAQKAPPSVPTAGPAEADQAVVDARAAITAVTRPAQAQQLKEATKPSAADGSDAEQSDTTAAEVSDDKGELTDAEHAELLKALHIAAEDKARRPEHRADGSIEAKTSTDAEAPAPAVPNTVTSPQTPMQAGLAQATTAVNGVHAADPRRASDPASDAAVPIANIAVEIATRAREGKNRFEIRLDPAELGRIDVRLDIDRQGNVTSRLLVERADTLDLLRRDFGNLERALNDAGLKTDSGSLQFAMRDQGFAGGGQQQNEFTRSARIIMPGETDTIAPTARYNIAQRSGVDIRV